MKAPLQIFLLGVGIVLTACAVARTSYHVVTAPVRLFTGGGEKHSETPAVSTTTTTTVATTSPVAASRPMASPTPVRRNVQRPHVASASASPSPVSTRKRQEEAKTKPASSPHASPAATEFPTAKAVPGKPGYVFDPFDPNGGYIDVSGYAPGSKVKDPATKKIFIVP